MKLLPSLLLSLMLAHSSWGAAAATQGWGQYDVVTNSSPIFVLDYNVRQNVILLPTADTTILITNTPQKSAGGYTFNNPLPYEPTKTTVHPWGVNIIISQPTNACFSVTLGNSSSEGSTLVLAGRTNSGAILRMVGNNSTATDIHIVEWVTNVHPAYAFGVAGGGGGGGGSFPSGVVAYYKFDESGTGARADSSGNGHTLDNATAGFRPNSRAGIINNGIDNVPGSFNWLEVADHADLSLGANVDFSFSFWINSDSLSALAYVFAKDSATQEYNCYVGTDGKINFQFWSGAGVADTATSTSAITTGANKHVVITYDQSNIRIYINGALDLTYPNTTDPRDSNSDFEVGRSEGAGGSYWDGLIDELGIWKRALSLAEVQALYNGGTGLQP